MPVRETTMRVTPDEQALILAIRKCPLGPPTILAAAAARFLQRAKEKEGEKSDEIDRVIIEQANQTAQILLEASEEALRPKSGEVQLKEENT